MNRMDDAQSQQLIAEGLTLEGTQALSSGAAAEAIQLLLQASLHYKESWRILDELEASVPPVWLIQTAVTCRLCANHLAAHGNLAQAAALYQEAVDAYTRMDSPSPDAHACAQELLECLQKIRERPESRLDLMITSLIRKCQALTFQPDKFQEQAVLCAHIASLYCKNDNYEEGVDYYEEAARLYSQIQESHPSRLDEADCLRRAAECLSIHLNNCEAAEQHYRSAMNIYSLYEAEQDGGKPLLSLCIHAINEMKKNQNKVGEYTTL